MKFNATHLLCLITKNQPTYKSNGLNFSSPGIFKKITSSSFLVLMLFIACFILGNFGSIYAQSTATYGSASSSGTFTFIVPAGVTSIKANVWGAGGAGASAGNTRPGAGGGGFSQGILAVMPTQTLTIVVGQGAPSPGGSASGSNGGNSSISTIIANGGGGSTSGNVIGSGGGASGGTINNTGGNGGQRFSSTSTGGGGGQGACLAGNGTNGQTVTAISAAGAGGTGGACGSASAGGNGAPSSGGSGAPGSFPGGGGGGNRSGSGGAGANGQVILEWNCPTSTSVSNETVCANNAATVTLSNTTVANLPIGTYTVNYTLGSPNATTTTATLTVTAAGTGTFTTGTLANSGSTSLTINSITSTSCVSTLSTGNTATITVNALTAITTQSSTATYCKDASATALSVAATGTPTITYEWFKNTTNSNTSGTSVGTGATYTPLTTTAGSLWYYAVASSSACNAVSSNAVEIVTGAVKNLTTGTCFPSIQASVNAAIDGDIIEILPGTYAESVTVDKNLSFKFTSDNDATITSITVDASKELKNNKSFNVTTFTNNGIYTSKGFVGKMVNNGTVSPKVAIIRL